MHMDSKIRGRGLGKTFFLCGGWTQNIWKIFWDIQGIQNKTKPVQSYKKTENSSM